MFSKYCLVFWHVQSLGALWTVLEDGAFGQKHTSMHIAKIASQNNAGLFSGKSGYPEYSALQLLINF